MAPRPLNSVIPLLLLLVLATSPVAFGQIADSNVRMKSLVRAVVRANDDETRSNAMQSLQEFYCGLGPAGRRKLSDRTVDNMAGALTDSDELTKGVIAHALGTLGARGRRVLPQLKEALRNDHLPERRGFGFQPAAVPLYRAIDAIEHDRPQPCDFGKP